MGKREYQKHEFCKAVNCEDLSDNNFCESNTTTCCHTAKEFHRWLQRNGFKIVKEIDKNHAYFIVYSFEDEDGKAGIANGAVDMTRPIRGPEDIREIQEIFRKKTGHKLCVLINWKKFEEDT